jgi:hypothetical protein
MIVEVGGFFILSGVHLLAKFLPLPLPGRTGKGVKKKNRTREEDKETRKM